MDEWQEVEHTDDCDWKMRKIKKTIKWWQCIGLRNCPTCKGKLL